MGSTQIGLSEEEEDVARAYLTDTLLAESEGLDEEEQDEARELWLEGVWIEGVVGTSEQNVEYREMLSAEAERRWGMVVGPTVAHIEEDVKRHLFERSGFAAESMMEAIHEHQRTDELRLTGEAPDPTPGYVSKYPLKGLTYIPGDPLKGVLGKMGWEDPFDGDARFRPGEHEYNFRDVRWYMSDWGDLLVGETFDSVRRVPVEDITRDIVSISPSVDPVHSAIIARKWLPIMLEERRIVIDRLRDEVLLDLDVMIKLSTGAQTTIEGAKEAIIFGTVFEAAQIAAHIARQTELMNGALEGFLSWGRLRANPSPPSDATGLGDLPPEVMEMILHKATETEPMQIIVVNLVHRFTSVIVSHVMIGGMISGWLSRLEAVRTMIAGRDPHVRGGFAKYQPVIDSIRDTMKKMAEAYAETASGLPELRQIMLEHYHMRMSPTWHVFEIEEEWERVWRTGSFTDEEVWYAVRSAIFDAEQTLLAARGLVLRAINEIRLIAEEHRNVFGREPPWRRRKLIGARMGEGRPSSTTACDVMLIGPKVPTVRPDVGVAPVPKKGEKTWLQERTENFVLVKDLVSKSFQDGCIGIGPPGSGAKLQLGRVLASGFSGTVFDARLVVRGDTVTVAVKVILHQGDEFGQDDEVRIADAVSERVREHETAHFLLLYGDGDCEGGYTPPGLEGYDRALQIQKWIDTAIKYISPSDAESLKSKDYENLSDYGLRELFAKVEIEVELTEEDLRQADEDFLDAFEYYLYTRPEDPIDMSIRVVMEPTPASVPMKLIVMERATYGISDFIAIQDPRTVHKVIGQFFQASKDFYEITGKVHSALHAGNVMVLERPREIAEYVMVLIDFGNIDVSDSPDVGMVQMITDFFSILRGDAATAELTTLALAIEAFLNFVETAPTLGLGVPWRAWYEMFPSKWASLRPGSKSQFLGARMGEGRPSSTTAYDVFRLL